MKKNNGFLLIAAVFIALLSSCDFYIYTNPPTGTVTGTVFDAYSEETVAGVTVTVEGYAGSTVTNTFGEFEIEVPEGLQVLNFHRDGYVFYDITVYVTAEATTVLHEDIVGYYPLAENDIRIVLTWGENPSDLDSHLRLPNNDTVDFLNKIADDNSASLDWDDMVRYGPETITISTQNPGTYYYSVHHFSGLYSLGTSEATVRVYSNSSLLATFRISAATSGVSTKKYWRVFSLSGSTISTINQYSDTAW